MRLPLPVRTLSVAAALALITGAVHVLVIAVRHLVGRDFVWLSREYVWMTPLGYLVIFVVLALPLGAIGAIAPRAAGPRVSGFVFGALGTLSLVLLIPGLHPLAALLVAIGVGTRIAVWLGAEPVGRGRVVGRVAALLLVTVAVAGAARAWHRGHAERRQIANLPAAPPDAPNVLLIILDTVRAASMSFLGYARETTPNLADFAAEGVVFEQAFVTAPWTLPSHAGMFTGHYPSQLSTDWQEPLNEEPTTLAEVLARHGYRTAGFVANHYYTTYESGLARGFERFEDYRLTAKQVLLSTTLTQTRLFWDLLQSDGIMPRLRALVRMDLRPAVMWTSDRKDAPQVTDEFLAWQAEAAASGRPFFAFLNYYDAHLPYDPPAPFRTRFAAEPAAIDLYDGSIAYIDHALGRLFGELARRGALDRTLVIVSSDHGEAFGEHGLHGHGNSMYLPELHVPLVVRYPARVAAGSRLRRPVTLRDLSATALDAAGLAGSGTLLPGHSWLRLAAEGDSAELSAVIAEVSAGVDVDSLQPVSRGAMRSLITDSLHYIINGDGIEEVYAWRTDRAEERDLVRYDSRPMGLDKLRRILSAALEARGVKAAPPTPGQAPP